MPELQLPPWFAQGSLVALAGYFLWSIRKILRDFEAQIVMLRKTMEKLFARDDDFERRISSIEGQCRATHNRRWYDNKNGDSQ